MSRARGPAGWLVACAIALQTTPATALARCDETCHLSQGTPLFVQDLRQIWVRRCTGEDEHERCRVSRRTLDDRLLAEQVAPRRFDRDFHDREIAAHTVVKLPFKGAWHDLAKPFPIGPFDDRPATTVRLEGETLIVASTGSPEARRSLGCAPKTVEVHAKASDGIGLVVATAKCVSPQRGAFEVVRVFTTRADKLD